MTHPPDLTLILAIPAALLGVAVIAALIWAITRLVRYLVADRAVRPLLRKAWRIKRTWTRTAHRVGLVQVEKSRPPFWSNTPTTTVITRDLVPTITVGVERWGVRVDVATIGRLGVRQFQDAADHLADTWRVPQVRVEQPRPGLVRLRALVTDPLTQWTRWTEDATRPADPATWLAGIDADGQPVTVRSSGVSGVVVAGLAGYGKTSFLNARFCQLAPSPAVQFVLIDGKGGPDYDDLFTRAWLWAKDDPQLVRDHLAKVLQLMTARQRSIRDLLQVKNMWHVGPSDTWPLVVVVIDEAHTFLNETKGTDAESKRLDALARETARLVEELIRKGRNVGIQVILATQKATGDAIPTKIRDNCQVAVSFAQRTSEAATAVLGSDISNAPDEHPRRLQDPDYIGVASMVAQGRPGFTLVRTPYVPDETADRIATSTAHLVRDPLAPLGRAGGDP
jgi:S-DNA-T family DNA segregation ATPase FtsK/SpoIIIE